MWPKTFIEWIEGDTAYLSVPFTWNLPAAYQRAVWLGQSYRVRAGGPAVALMSDYLSGVAEIGGDVDAITRHNPQATYTSRGCIRHCSFCAVPKIEGDLVELDDWPVRPVICDNNLLACSVAHFDKVIDRLKVAYAAVDFNQGLDARLLTKHHAQRLAEVAGVVRLAWDSVGNESEFMRAFGLLRSVRIPKDRIRVYVMLGYKDTPEDARYRLETVHRLGIKPNPMRYNPLDALERDAYVGEYWTDNLERQYMRYWANLRFTASVPFDEWLNREHCTMQGCTYPALMVAS